MSLFGIPLPGPGLIAKLKLYAIIAMATIIAIAAAYGIGRWQGAAAKADSIYSDMAREDAKAQKLHDDIIGSVAEMLSKQKSTNTTVYNKAVETVRKDTVFVECKLPAEMQELIRQSQQMVQP